MALKCDKGLEYRQRRSSLNILINEVPDRVLYRKPKYCILIRVLEIVWFQICQGARERVWYHQIIENPHDYYQTNNKTHMHGLVLHGLKSMSIGVLGIVLHVSIQIQEAQEVQEVVWYQKMIIRNYVQDCDWTWRVSTEAQDQVLLA